MERSWWRGTARRAPWWQRSPVWMKNTQCLRNAGAAREDQVALAGAADPTAQAKAQELRRRKERLRKEQPDRSRRTAARLGRLPEEVVRSVDLEGQAARVAEAADRHRSHSRRTKSGS